MTEDFISEPKEYPSQITMEALRDLFVSAGLPCHLQQFPGEVWIVFEQRNSRLMFKMSPEGHPLTAEMPDDLDYDPDFACVVFDVFDSIGWSFREND